MIVLHPKMTAYQVHDWCERFAMQVEIVHRARAGLFLVIATARPAPTRTHLVYSCALCMWTGDEPSWFDYGEWCLPAIGDIPQCPNCGGLCVRLISEDLITCRP